MSDNTLTFEKVSIAEARAVLRGLEGKTKEDPNWVEKRHSQIPSDMALLKETQDWLGGLPERVQPSHTAVRFPRVANKIFNAWRRPEVCLKVFDELMTDSRGTRQGFPIEVAREITNLRFYYTNDVYKMKQDSWVLTA